MRVVLSVLSLAWRLMERMSPADIPPAPGGRP
jgi:hypothetical protein